MELRLGGVPEHFNLPWHLAMESGALADLELSWQDQPGGTGAMITGLADGSLDVVSILTEGVVAAIDGGLAATVIQVYVESPLQWGVHVPAQSDLTDEAQLRGRRIAISRFNSGSHLMAFVQADRLDWDVTDEQFVVVGGLDGAREAFAAGTADQFLWDRYMTQFLVDNGEFRRVGVQPTPWPSFVIAVRNDVLHAQTTAVGRIVDEVIDQATALHARPDIVTELTSRYELDETSAGAWLDSTTFASRAAVDAAMLDETLATLRRAGFG